MAVVGEDTYTGVCWKMKQANIRAEEKADAEAAYKKAKEVYERIFKEASE